MCVIVNVNACSVNGFISSFAFESDEDRSKYGLTCAADQLRVLELLKNSCAVITGATSLKAAQNTWQVNNHNGLPVEWFVFTNAGLPRDLPFWLEHGPRTLVTSEIGGILEDDAKFAESQGVNIFRYKSDPAIELYGYLQSKGFKTTLLFGGSKINKMFFDAGLVSRIELTLSPVILASSGSTPYIDPGLKEIWQLKLVTSQAHGDHVFLTYDVLSK